MHTPDSEPLLIVDIFAERRAAGRSPTTSTREFICLYHVPMAIEARAIRFPCRRSWRCRLPRATSAPTRCSRANLVPGDYPADLRIENNLRRYLRPRRHSAKGTLATHPHRSCWRTGRHDRHATTQPDAVHQCRRSVNAHGRCPCRKTHTCAVCYPRPPHAALRTLPDRTGWWSRTTNCSHPE